MNSNRRSALRIIRQVERARKLGVQVVTMMRRKITVPDIKKTLKGATEKQKKIIIYGR